MIRAKDQLVAVSAYWSLALLVCLFSGLTIAAYNQQEKAWFNAVRETYSKAQPLRRVQDWRALVNQAQALPEPEQLNVVNRFFNQLQFIPDHKLWGEEDYWATPVEFLAAGGGDCEDFSIAKYFTLLELGVPQDKLRLVYVKALELDQFHMVVAYYSEPTAMPVLLDNLDPSIKPANERPDLAPVYSFNGQHLWLMKEQGRGQKAGKASRLTRWNELRGGFESNRLNKPLLDLD
ncbi:transglutaminase-like cysteine peptidase [Motilimonas pumila]|uniref:Sulfate adenylyltransferase n=1 Tax=Motilimonas pumila TaxID=2303987 RepID=A0A418YBZ3_9GAMM|nr:transglutaminase-like cysteine peptidase [Motilimonas pumila]RJG42045.1 sulfate adenylyltransferase [Motilimonas pumila]